ncbi:MAG TPA: ImmA/IrrE family metallo-endopeptidase [Pseudobdellovibrionaceae bacterium]|jgi:Zn-dependent peptidase ImmA (M78 family)
MDFDSITVPVVKGISCAQIENEAADFLQLFAPECLHAPQPTPILEIFENKMNLLGFDVLIGKNVKGLGGFTDITNRYIELPNSTYKKLEKGDPQARFTVAHEFGHVKLHSAFQGKGQNHPVTFARRSRIRAFEDPEWQANSFSAAILMPIQTMRMLHAQDKMTPAYVMATYQVSWPAASRRILRLRELRWRKNNEAE